MIELKKLFFKLSSRKAELYMSKDIDLNWVKIIVINTALKSLCDNMSCHNYILTYNDILQYKTALLLTEY